LRTLVIRYCFSARFQNQAASARLHARPKVGGVNDPKIEPHTTADVVGNSC